MIRTKPKINLPIKKVSVYLSARFSSFAMHKKNSSPAERCKLSKPTLILGASISFCSTVTKKFSATRLLIATRGIDEEVYKIIDEKKLYARNGIQKQLFNSIYQLMAIKKYQSENLAKAEHF